MVLAKNPLNDETGAPVDSVDSITPDPFQARMDEGEICTAGQAVSEVEVCVSGDEAAEIEVALVGDSHAAQWTAPLATIAENKGWRLTNLTKANCPYTAR